MICRACGQSSDREVPITDEQRSLLRFGLCTACYLMRGGNAEASLAVDAYEAPEFDYGKPFPEELR